MQPTPQLLEFGLAALVVALALFARPVRFADRTAWCMAILAVLPVALRLVLLHNHPVPLPDIYDEFGHLFVADTLRNFRMANPPHALPQFFETFFILQQPTYSSIYPIGQGLILLFGWGGVLFATGAFCALCYWMLRGWTTPEWSLLGGFLAVMECGPLNQWTNSYWGGGLAAAAGCLVFGALPRGNPLLLGIGIGIHMLVRPYETVFLVVSVLLFRLPFRTLAIAALIALPALGVTLLQNHSVTGNWTTLPYSLSQQQYGVPATLTFQKNAEPHRALTKEQEMDYRMQRAFRSSETETPTTYWQRLVYRVRYYRFYFYPPLYLALLAFLVKARSRREWWMVATALLFALGTNFFPAFQFHYLAAIVCLFILMSVNGLARRGVAARPLIFLCVAIFVYDYTSFAMAKTPPNRRTAVAADVAAVKGRLLIFVRYWPAHHFQEEWVWNEADIDKARVVWARDLGEPENEKLRRYFPDRAVWLLEPDANPPQLTPYIPEPPPPAPEAAPQPQNKQKPGLVLEQVF